MLNPQNIFTNILLKNDNRSIFARLNIYSMQNKFDLLVTIVNKNINVFLISETKIDSSFPIAEYHIEEYATPYRLDKDIYGGAMLLYMKENIPFLLFNFDVSINSGLFCSYKSHKNQISSHLKEMRRKTEVFSSNYDNLILLGNFNVERT